MTSLFNLVLDGCRPSFYFNLNDDDDLPMPQPYHHANSARTLFRNPWQIPDQDDANTSAGIASSSWLWQLPALLGNIPLEWAKELKGHNLSPVKVVTPDFNNIKLNKKAIKVTWLGHAVCTSYINIQL